MTTATPTTAAASTLQLLASAWSVQSGGGTCAKTGTSMAAPHVASAAAYVKLFHPDYSVGQLYDELKACALDLGEEREGSVVRLGLREPGEVQRATQTQAPHLR